MSLAADPRWVKLNGEGLACSCGERHVGLFPLQMIVPAGWQGPQVYADDADVRMDGTFLSANYAVVDGRYFAMRMRLPLPIAEQPDQALLFTVWASVERPAFEAQVAGGLKPGLKAHARLLNRIGGYPDTFRMMGVCGQQADGPPYLLIDVMQPDGPRFPANPLGRDQRQGITLDKAFEIYAAQGHDMRGSFPPN